MLSFHYYLLGVLDSLAGHLMFVAYLLAVTDEPDIWIRLKKLPPLLLYPFVSVFVTFGLYTLVNSNSVRYFAYCLITLSICTLWVKWAWRWDFLRSFCAVCMSAILQVAVSALVQVLFLLLPSGWGSDLFAMAAALFFSVTAAVLLKKLRFGAWFRLLLEDRPNLRRTAGLLFALEASMETFLLMQNGVQEQYLAAYYMLVAMLAIVIIELIIHLAQRFDDSRTLRIQQDIIAQQQLYEQSLEDIRREVRSFRHDYKNLLAGLSQQAGEGELEAIRFTLSELDADFDRHLGEKIRLSTQIGNLQIPQVRSLLLSKLADMQKKGVEYRLEVLYPIKSIRINVWDFVRCLGILTDNAVEAAQDAKEPWVEIILLVQDRRLFLRISNPYVNRIDPGEMWDDGWSTKGTGRGLGLAGYRRILEKYPHASSCTSWEGGVFVQELTVEDRT